MFVGKDSTNITLKQRIQRVRNRSRRKKIILSAMVAGLTIIAALQLVSMSTLWSAKVL